MIILGIETSCDETTAAVLEQKNNRITILSNVVASSASLQAKYGGIIPEQAAREQLKSIIPVIEEALAQAFPKERLPRPFGARNDAVGIDAIAVTYGPGLIGSLLVGVETAKVLATIWNKPIIPINHLLGHFYANWIQAEHLVPAFPCLGLLVSGGHTDLVLFTDHGKYKYLGGTRDDAAGECFDKCARLLGLPYPGGPEISKLASQGQALRFKLPIPMKGSRDFDFSYSGLKTAVANLIKTNPVILGSEATPESDSGQARMTHRANLAASIENAIVTSLVDKVIQALRAYPVKNVMLAGGVAANKKLADRLQVTVDSLDSSIKLHIPPPELCTDNAAMIAAAGFFESKRINPLNLQADPNLALSY